MKNDLKYMGKLNRIIKEPIAPIFSLEFKNQFNTNSIMKNLKHTKESVIDKILQKVMNKCWYEDDGSTAVYYDIVESVVNTEVSKLIVERDDLLEALIEAKKVILSLNPTQMTEEKMNEYAIKGGTWDKIQNAINKATK